MSLQVWLPLIGDLHNQGLLNWQPSLDSGTTASYINGKIGQALNTGAITMPAEITAQILNNNNYSYTCWFCALGASGSTTERAMIFGNDGMSTLGGRQFSLFQYSTANDLHWSWQNYTNGTYSSAYGGVLSGVFPTNQWVHLAITYNNPNVKIYINGQIKYTGSWVSNADSFEYNTKLIWNSQYHKINDIRLYDHCLSDKEVEEIAKGLVLHYKLDDSYVESSTILTSGITSTAYNGATGKYGYNTDSNLGKIEGHFQGKDCIKIYTLTAGQTARPYVYFDNLFTSDGTNQPAYKALSFDYYTTVTTTTWLNIYKLGSGEGTATWKTINSDGIHSGIYTNSANSIIVKPNEWNHIEVVFHGTTSANAEWGYCINGPNHTSSADNYFLYANIQLEQNDHVTGHGANFHSNIVYDSSGYSNHGDTTNTIITNSTVRYDVATILNGTTVDNSSNTKVGAAYLRGFLPLTTPSALTITWWGKNDAYGRGGILQTTINSDPSECTDYSTTAIANWDSTFRIYNGSTAINFFSNFIKDGTWHYHTITFDGATAKYYCDGIQKVSSALTGTLPSFNGFCMGLGKAGGVYRQIKQTVSDVRIYATALTAEQVAELYHTSASIDNKGNTYARELVEK